MFCDRFETWEWIHKHWCSTSPRTQTWTFRVTNSLDNSFVLSPFSNEFLSSDVFQDFMNIVNRKSYTNQTMELVNLVWFFLIHIFSYDFFYFPLVNHDFVACGLLNLSLSQFSFSSRQWVTTLFLSLFISHCMWCFYMRRCAVSEIDILSFLHAVPPYYFTSSSWSCQIQIISSCGDYSWAVACVTCKQTLSTVFIDNWWNSCNGNANESRSRLLLLHGLEKNETLYVLHMILSLRRIENVENEIP